MPSNQTSGSLESGQVSSGTGQGRVTGVLPGQAAAVTDTTAAASAPSLSVVPSETYGANGERLPMNNAASALPAPAAAKTPTPTLDAATAAAQRRLSAKTARQQQQVYSVAPRTNNDKTDQMPDDPIIRY
jgi:hypothetical protein